MTTPRLTRETAAWLVLLAIAGAAALGLLAMLRPGDAEQGIGRPAPPLAGPALATATPETGPLVDAAGPWLVNFWASWCGPCREEHPLLMELHAAGVPIVGISYQDRREAALEWLHDRGNPYRRTITDPAGKIAEAWGVEAIPVTLLVDGDGIVRFRHTGALRPATIRRELLHWFEPGGQAAVPTAPGRRAALPEGAGHEPCADLQYNRGVIRGRLPGARGHARRLVPDPRGASRSRPIMQHARAIQAFESG